MKIQRTIPPAASPVSFRDVLRGFAGLLPGRSSVIKLEAEVREYFGVKHAFAFCSGKAALTVTLVALKSLSSRRKVLIPAYTCFSVPSAVVKAGLDVSLCDIDPRTLDFDWRCLEANLGEDTLCVVPTHLLGLPADVDRVNALCRQRGVFVVEDAAQAMGGKVNGRLLGTLGDVGLFSLGRGKNITCGSGGILVTNSDEIARAIQIEHAMPTGKRALAGLRNLCEVLVMSVFIDPRLYWLPAGLPFLKLGETKFCHDFDVRPMSKVEAGLMARWRERLEQANAARLEGSLHLIHRVPPWSSIPRARVGEQISYLRLPVMMESKQDKDRLCALSVRYGFGISPLYPTAVQHIPELQGRVEPRGSPGAQQVSERLVTLPVHELVSGQDRERICKMLDQLGQGSSGEYLPSSGHVPHKPSASPQALPSG